MALCIRRVCISALRQAQDDNLRGESGFTSCHPEPVGGRSINILE